MNKNHTNLVVLFLLFLIASCTSDDIIILEDRLVDMNLSGDKIFEIYNDHHVKYLTDDDIVNYSISNIDSGDNHDIRGLYSAEILNDHIYIFSKNAFKILKYRIDMDALELIEEFGSSGRGPGEGSFINSYSINNNGDIIIYDSSLNKLVYFNNFSEIVFEHILNDAYLPYHISAIEHVHGNTYLVTGISINEWRYLNQRKPYHNVYLLEITPTQIELLDSKSIIPKNILTGLESNDIATSTVTSPFGLSRIDNSFYLFNTTSNQIFNLNIIDNEIKIEYTMILKNDLFIEHPKLSQEEYTNNALSRMEWNQNGNFMINIFSNNENYFIYTSNIINENEILYKLISLDKNDFNNFKKNIIKTDKIIRNITNEDIHFFSFNYAIGLYSYIKSDIDLFN